MDNDEHKYRGKRWLYPSRCCSPLLMGLSLGWAADAPAINTADELALFSEMPVIVSASRQKTAINKSPVPVSVITQEDIQAGGHYRISEMLRFVPGVDVQRIDRNYYGIGVRGFHGIISDRTLTLINGRNADSVTYGGSEFYRQPILAGNIDHIEIVRGPGSAAWGANAFNGVINIITKDPEDNLGVHGSSTVTGFGDSYTEARWNEVSGPWSWRVGAFYEYHKSSSTALDDQAFPDNDWGDKKGTDNELILRLNGATTVRAGLAYSDINSGSLEFLGNQSTLDDELNTTRAFLRFDQRLSDDFSYHLNWYGNLLEGNRQAVFHDRTQENVVEFQADFNGIENHNISFGGEWRLVDIEILSPANPGKISLTNNTYHEQRYGAFFIDRFEINSHIAIEGQIRGDVYSGTDEDWAGRLAVLYSVDRQQQHILRVATARAYRTPMPASRDTMYTGALTVVPNSDLKNEQTWSVEAGYNGELPSDMIARVDTYYQKYEDLIGFARLSTAVQPQNIGGATGYGGEVELGWSPMMTWSAYRAKWHVWYSLNYMETERVNQEIRAFLPARHKVGTTMRLPLPDRFSFNLNYAYNNSTTDPDVNVSTPQHTAPHHQCDLSLSYLLPRWRGEVMIGVWDVFHKDDPATFASATYMPHKTPGRTFFIRGQLGF